MLRALLIVGLTVFLLACGKKGSLLPPPTPSADKVIQPQKAPPSTIE
jgi:predicted small lipoprotein YifL